MHLIQVPKEAVAALWPRVEEYLARAIERTCGTHTVETTRAQLVDGDRQLWIVVGETASREVSAACVTSLQKFPSGMLGLQIELLGGANMKNWFTLKELLEDWAKKEGCSAAFLWARKGWAKHLRDYRVTHYLMYKELK